MPLPLIPMALAGFNWLKDSWVGKAVAILLFLAGGWYVAKRQGAKAEQAAQAAADMEFGADIKERADATKKQVTADVADMSHADLVKRLRAKGGLRD